MRLSTTLACTFLVTSPAFGVDSQDETPPEPTETTTACEEGQIYDAAAKACVDAEKQSFNDDDRYRAIRELAYAGDYRRARLVLAAVENPQDAGFLNYQGFIARKEGRMAAAMAHYQAALRADPDYLLARSYMCMGLVVMGDVTAAETQLEEIAARGGHATWAFAALQRAIAGEPSGDY